MGDSASTLLTEAREFVEAQRAYYHSPKAWADSRPGRLLERIDAAIEQKVAVVAVVNEPAAVAELVGVEDGDVIEDGD